jgi:metallo-beta-lactamase family protein
MKLSFHGAARGVTGSCHLVECAGQKVLVDCGMFQGPREIEEENTAPFGFSPGQIDVLLLTHAHLDHCGRLPLLVKRGFRGAIVATAATHDLARLVMLDSAYLHEEAAKRAQRHGKSDQPLYDTMDALDAVDRFGQTADYGVPIDLAPGITATFFDAGHILGSASILLELTEDGRKRKLLFSGDIGPQNRLLLNEPAPPEGADIVVMESTYGDRDHRPLDNSLNELYAAIRGTLSRGGNVIIPTFALERTQEILFALHKGVEQGAIPKSLPVYLDSPMAISATRIFGRHPGAMRPEIAEMIHSGRDPFGLPGLKVTREAAESMKLNDLHGGAVIMAGSGMCTGGRVRHHLRHNLPNPDSSVIFIGFAAEGTPARAIVDGATELKLFGKTVPVRASVHTINGFSAHAGRQDLIAWHARTGARERTFLVHGEEKPMKALAEALAPARVDRPRPHQSFDI